MVFLVLIIELLITCAHTHGFTLTRLDKQETVLIYSFLQAFNFHKKCDKI